METIKNRNCLWEPSREYVEQSNLTKYLEWLRGEKGLEFRDYNALWEWSVGEIEDFWSSIWEFFSVKASKPYSKVLSQRKMPGTKWFVDSELNYAEHVFGNMSPDRPALIFQSELQPQVEISWNELYQKVSSVAAGLRAIGVKRGDRVISYLPNIPEAVIALLASISIGAVWSSCSPDFGSRSVIDRFKQIEPKVLFAVDGYNYGKKVFDRLSILTGFQDALNSVKKTILVPYLYTKPKVSGLRNVLFWEDLLEQRTNLVFEQVPFNHPLWVLYSSGTTGLPKALVQSQGGVLLEFLKMWGLHCDIKPGDRMLWFTTTGWVMWNMLFGVLLLGATAVLFDGNPGFPNMDVLWELTERAGVTVFGMSPAFIASCMQAGVVPKKEHNLSKIKGIGTTGAPLPSEGFRWIYDQVKKDVHLWSMSGGTDVSTAFVGGCPLLPVNAGEIQCRCLGAKVEAFDEAGKSLTDEVGELVVTEPMPSMPLYLWNDPENKRYMESYFDMYPGVWRHGDWIKITPQGSAIIYGRSDSTLKRMGVRMGSSEIYSAVEELPEIVDSLIVGFDSANGVYRMPLFVVLKEGVELHEKLKTDIKNKIRNNVSPRHMPDEIYAVTEIPRTLNDKKLEVPVKRMLMGVPLKDAVNVDSMKNPASLQYFVDLAVRFRSEGRT